MATPTPVKMGAGTIGTGSAGTQYTVPAATTSILKSFDIANTTSQLIRVRVWLVDSGDSADTTNAIAYDHPIPGNREYQWEGEQVLATGDTIQTEADASGLCFRGSGVQLA